MKAKHGQIEALPRRLTTAEAVLYLGITPDVLKKLRAQRRISFFRHGHRALSYSISDLDAYLERIREPAIWETKSK